jgi:outer membrane protein assembly factor BamB
MRVSVEWTWGSVLGLAVAGIAVAALAGADDWPQWRGPNRDGRSPSEGLLQSWPDGGPPVAWRASGLGAGYSTVSVAGDRIFTMGDLEDGQHVLALSRDDGAHLWKRKIGPSWPEENFPGPRSTPTVDGERVYALGTDGDLVALDAASGEPVWHRNLKSDFGGAQMLAQGKVDWRFAESVLVDGDRLVVTPGASDATLVALNKHSGEELWRTAVPELGEAGGDGAGYSSAVVSEACGVRQYVQLLGRGVVGVEAETGRFLWGYNRVANKVANIPTPIVDGDRVFATSGYGTGAALLEIACEGDGVEAREVYFLPPETMQNHHGGVVLHDGYLYTGTGHNRGFPLAVELETGAVAWGPIRNAGKNSAAVAYADGHLYMRYQNGLMLLVEATPEEYREKGSFMIPDVVEESWAHPVVVDGRLYLREQGDLHCYDIAASAL